MSNLKFLCSLACLLCMPLLVIQAQETSVTVSDSIQQSTPDIAKITPKKPQKKVYEATYLSLDIFDPIATAFTGKFEVSVAADVSLWHRLFPAIELGVMGYNQQQDDYHYTTAGGFIKVGANYNFLNYKPNRKKDHAVFAGVRYGYSFTSYQLQDAHIANQYWNETGVYSNDKRTAHFGWVEFQIGVRVQVYKQFFMGAALEIRTFGHYYQKEPYYPSTIAGFGSDANTTNFGLLYHLTYQFPAKK